MACVLIYSAQQILGTIYPGSHRTKYTYHKVIAMKFLKAKRKKPPLSHWYVTALFCLPWSNCLTQLKMVPLNTTRVSASPGHSRAGVQRGRTFVSNVMLKNYGEMTLCLVPGSFTQLPNHLVCRCQQQKVEI